MWIKQLFFISYLCSQSNLSANDAVGQDFLLPVSAFLPCPVKSGGWKGRWFLGGLLAAVESSIWSQSIPESNKENETSVLVL